MERRRQAELVADEPAPTAVEAARPIVVDGDVLHVIEIEPYPNATAALGGCTSFQGVYVTDPDEIDAIRRRVRWGR
jgi:hypothetical protein